MGNNNKWIIWDLLSTEVYISGKDLELLLFSVLRGRRTEDTRLNYSFPVRELTHSLPPPTHTHTYTAYKSENWSHTLIAPILRLPSFHCLPGPTRAYVSSSANVSSSASPFPHFPTCIARCPETAAGFWGPLTTSIWSTLKRQWQVSGPQVENWQPSISRRCCEPVQHRRLKWPEFFL